MVVCIEGQIYYMTTYTNTKADLQPEVIYDENKYAAKIEGGNSECYFVVEYP